MLKILHYGILRIQTLLVSGAAPQTLLISYINFRKFWICPWHVQPDHCHRRFDPKWHQLSSFYLINIIHLCKMGATNWLHAINHARKDLICNNRTFTSVKLTIMHDVIIIRYVSVCIPYDPPLILVLSYISVRLRF